MAEMNPNLVQLAMQILSQQLPNLLRRRGMFRPMESGLRMEPLQVPGTAAGPGDLGPGFSLPYGDDARATPVGDMPMSPDGAGDDIWRTMPRPDAGTQAPPRMDEGPPTYAPDVWIRGTRR